MMGVDVPVLMVNLEVLNVAWLRNANSVRNVLDVRVKAHADNMR